MVGFKVLQTISVNAEVKSSMIGVVVQKKSDVRLDVIAITERQN